MKLAVDLSVWTIYCMKHIFVLKLTFFCQTWIFFLDLRTFLSNFVPTDVNALLLKSYPEDFRPILSWVSSNPILSRNLSNTPGLYSAPVHLIICVDGPHLPTSLVRFGRSVDRCHRLPALSVEAEQRSCHHLLKYLLPQDGE